MYLLKLSVAYNVRLGYFKPSTKRGELKKKLKYNKVIAMTRIFNLDYSRVEVAADTRRRPVKQWSSTANGPQRSRCGEIGSPGG